MRHAKLLLLIVPFASAYACGQDPDSPNDPYTGETDAAGPGVDAPIEDAPGVDGIAPGNDGGRDLGNDRSKFFGASRCAGAGLLLCEDFETGTLDTTTWKVSGSAPVIDGVHTARGNKALHITKLANGASYIKETKTFPVANNTYFGRAFVWFDKLPVPEPVPNDAAFAYAHWTFVAASGTGVSGEIRLSGQLSKGANLFGVGTDNRVDDAGTGDWTSSDKDPSGTPLPVPTGAWLCIEWMHAGQTNETRFYRDATEHPSLYTTAAMHGGNANPYILPEFTNVWIGWQEYQPTDETFEMWVDEVAIDTARIGCVL